MARTKTSLVDHSKTFQEFEGKLTECTRTAVCGRAFVLVGKLQDWLRSQATPTATHIERQLHAAYQSRLDPNLPVRLDIFNAGDDCYLLIFCILRSIGHGDLIHIFTEKGKSDGQLPLSPADVESIFRTANASDLATKFSEKQHRFKPAKFRFQRYAEWNQDVVIPFCSKSPINEGGTAHLWHVVVPEEFIEDRLRKESARSRFQAAPKDSDPDWCYEFALKTFTSKDQKVFNNEKDAFISLEGREDMVRYLGSFKKMEVNHPLDESGLAASSSSDHHNTCNILLEFADMDLSVYFQNRSPPVLSKEIKEFWKALFAIAKAVKDIHNFKSVRGEEVREYHGWHTDIKPDNILAVEDTGDGICKFKLADPGFAQFEPKDPKPAAVPKRLLWGGTKTYGPPEYPGGSEHPVSQAIDIWSLGCVFSLATTWVILGFVGVLQFNEVRKMAIEEIHRSPSAQDSKAAPADERTETDQFHDGDQLLDVVTLWHSVLRGQLRQCDATSAQVLDLIDKRMLVTNPADRINADDLCKQLEEMLVKSSEGTDSVPPKIQDNLIDIDKKVAMRLEAMRRSKSAEQGTVGGVIASSKSKPIDLIQKTTHRQSILPSGEKQIQQRRQGLGMTLETHLETIPPPSAIVSPYRPQKEESKRGYGRKESSASKMTLTGARPNKKSRKHPPQNVFQAREAVEHRDKRNKKTFPIFSRHHQTKKDEVLTNYFKDRDIKFLVDNAESMGPDWFQATYLLETLVMKAKGQDPDGMDLNFTTGNVKLGNEEKPSIFVQKMTEGCPQPGVWTNIIESLGTIFNAYLNRLRNTRNEARDVTLIVLTDGAWKGTTNKEHVSDKIVDFLAELERQTFGLKHRPFSIEFVQFGRDDEASKRLKHLDNFLREESIRYKDMIDTEHAYGDVNKMLLGSFVEAYDEDEDDEDLDVARDTSSPYLPHGPTSSQDAMASPSNLAERGTYEHEDCTPLMSGA